MRFPLFLLFIACIAFSQSVPTEGGNISDVDAHQDANSSWHGVCGQTATSAPVPITVTATPGNVTYLTINTGAASCANGVSELIFLFSNSSTAITSLTRGNLTVLDSFINRMSENATSTFVMSSTFTTANFGTITGVPTTYTNSVVPGTFRLGYLQDQAGNLVFATPPVSNQAGFNGTLFDFQLMLPTRNGTDVPYYLTVDLLCNTTNATNVTPPHPPGGGGGGTHTPYWNQTGGNVTPPIEPPGGNGTNISQCEIILYCAEWGACADGYRYQACRDQTNCSNTEVFRVEKCLMPPGNETAQPTIEDIPQIIVKPEFPCCLPLLLLLILLPVYVVLKRLREKKEKGRRQ
jgi:hypothetical protein